MVSLVLIAHSAELAESAKALAEQVAAGRVRIAAAGGMDDAQRPFGTDAVRVARAIQAVRDPDGVLVLVDLGSALLSAETAIELLPAGSPGEVRISAAPLVEGAVAAAVVASAGASLDEVEREAQRALLPKQQHLGTGPAPERDQRQAPDVGPALTADVVVPNALGIHVRPAAAIVGLATRFDAAIEMENRSRPSPSADARSLTQVALLDAHQGDSIRVRVTGRQAEAALQAIVQLARSGFGEDRAPEFPPLADRVPPAGGALHGLPASPGVALGPARFFGSVVPMVPERAPLSAGEEGRRLNDAIRQAESELTALTGRASRGGRGAVAIFEAQRLLLSDPELHGRAQEALRPGGTTAERAWQSATMTVAELYASHSSPLLRARAADVRDVAQRVLRALMGLAGERLVLPRPSIVIADELTPSDLAAFHPPSVLGVATAAGAPGSHSSILARALGFPMVVGLGSEVMELADGITVGLDGDGGVLFLNPSVDRRAELIGQRDRWSRRRAEAEAACGKPAVTSDGRSIEVAANIGRLDELPLAVRLGAEGIGVLRTEFLFLDRSEPPTEAEQEAAYRQVLQEMPGERIVIRTLDIGGDKPVPYLPALNEANPFLGERGIRLSLRHPELFLTQARALWRAATDGRLHVLLPMVTTRGEVVRARALLAQAREQVLAGGAVIPDRLPLGIMIETPATVLSIDHLLPEVDFVSLGTNDLTQYTLAAERGNPRLADLFDACHPAVLRQIALVVEAAHRHGKWAGVCGEIAADPQAIPILVGLGVDELSMAPASIPAAKELIRRVSFSEVQLLARRALELGSAGDVRSLAPA
jgi:phosphocarrier protein FPr